MSDDNPFQLNTRMYVEAPKRRVPKDSEFQTIVVNDYAEHGTVKYDDLVQLYLYDFEHDQAEVHLLPDDAERIGLMLIAAAREVRSRGVGT